MLRVTKTSHQLHSSAQSLVLVISNVAIGARGVAVDAMCEKPMMALQRFNIASALKYVGEGIKRVIIHVPGNAMMMIVVSATASVK